MLKPTQTIESLSSSEWWGVTREMHAYLDSRKLTNRIEIFNAQFGMNRGIATAFFAILVASLWRLGLHSWNYEILLAACAVVSLYRMHKFSVLISRPKILMTAQTSVYEVCDSKQKVYCAA